MNSVTYHGAAPTTPNELNQYVQCVVPGVIDVTGLAPSAATVTVNSSATGITRHNDWYYKPETATNTSNAVWTSLAIASNYGGDANRNAFLPLTPEPFTYDLDGNLLSDGRWDYTYDAENRLITMQTRASVLGPIPNAEARRLEFKYDYLGRRVQKTVRGGWNGTSYTTVVSDTKCLYNGWNLLHEFSVDGATLTTVRSNIWGLDWSGTLQGAGGVGGLLYHNDVVAGVTMLPAYDGSGNVAAMLKRSDSSGTMVAAYEYDAYGNTLRSTGAHAASNPFRFSTKYTDAETGLVYHETRYYSPTLGRFITRDSIGEQGGLNLYAYISNRVPNGWDYLGMIAKSDGSSGTAQDDPRRTGESWEEYFRRISGDGSVSYGSYVDQDGNQYIAVNRTTGQNQSQTTWFSVQNIDNYFANQFIASAVGLGSGRGGVNALGDELGSIVGGSQPTSGIATTTPNQNASPTAPNNAATAAAGGSYTGVGATSTVVLNSRAAVVLKDGQVRILDRAAAVPGQGARQFHLDVNGSHLNANVGPLRGLNHQPVSPSMLVYGSEAFLKSVSRITLVGGLAVDAVMVNTAAPNQLGAAYGGVAGGWGGAAAGAGIGFAVGGPIGAVVGGFIGGFGGGWGGSVIGDRIQNGPPGP